MGKNRGKNWGHQIIEIIRKLVENGMSQPEISKIIDLSQPQVHMICVHHGIKMFTKKGADQQGRLDNKDLFIEPVREAERQKIYNKYKGKAMMWLALSDEHYPFQDNDLIDRALSEDVDGMVTSEVLDFYGLSVFRKDKFIACTDELMGGIKLMERAKKKLKNVVWFEANHERRLWKIVQDRLAGREDVIEALDIEPPLMKRMLDVGVDATVSWWCRLGNVVFAHPDWFSQIQLRTAEGTQDYFLKLGIKKVAWIDCIVNNHTHRQGQTTKYGVHLWENGCGCKRMDYIDEGRKRLEMGKGYALIKVEANGTFNVNESRIVRCE